MKAGIGSIRLVNVSTGTFVNIAVTDTSQVSFSGNTVTINPTADLLGNTDYEVRINAPGTIKDIAGNNFATLTNPINFTTGNFSLSVPAASGTATGTSGNDVLIGTFGNNTMLGGAGVDTFVWMTTNGSGDGIGTDFIDAVAGERLDFDMSILQTLKLSNGSLLSNGNGVLSGALLGGLQPSLALTDPSTLAFDWNGDGIADLTIKFATAPHSLTFDAPNGDLLVG